MGREKMELLVVKAVLGNQRTLLLAQNFHGSFVEVMCHFGARRRRARLLSLARVHSSPPLAPRLYILLRASGAQSARASSTRRAM